MNRNIVTSIITIILSLAAVHTASADTPRKSSFNANWKFNLGEADGADKPEFADTAWRSLDLPHDWMIEGPPGKDPSLMEGPFDPKSPGGAGNGYLNGGVGWYRKTFTVPADDKGKHIAIDFDGVYMLSHVWINGHDLGVHPYGYTSFEYDLTPFLKFGDEKNVIAVRAEVIQPCSRFYSGAGIYRNVWLTTTSPLHVDHWGTFVTADVHGASARVKVRTTVINNGDKRESFEVDTNLLAPDGSAVGTTMTTQKLSLDPGQSITNFQWADVTDAKLWSIQTPMLYHVSTMIKLDTLKPGTGKQRNGRPNEVAEAGATVDQCETAFGIRSIEFTVDKGFFLNGQHVQIQGVCDHHDLGCLGAAINRRAIQRQLEILKSFGVNGIRTSHYPPAPELLELADEMGFVVMDEAFDEWKHSKTRYGYGQYFDDWSERDIASMVDRDRNHPSVVHVEHR